MLVQRANVVLAIKDESMQHYLDLGYNILNDEGKLLFKAIPSDLGELRKFYVDATKKINELEAEVNDLKAKLAVKPKKPASKVEE